MGVQDLLPPFVWLLELTVVVLTIAGVWRTFEAAGQPGWAVLVPGYNVLVLTRAAREEWPAAVCLFIPLLNVLFLLIVSYGVARRFGRGRAFAAGLAFLPFVFYPVLGLVLLRRREQGAPA